MATIISCIAYDTDARIRLSDTCKSLRYRSFQSGIHTTDIANPSRSSCSEKHRFLPIRHRNSSPITGSWVRNLAADSFLLTLISIRVYMANIPSDVASVILIAECPPPPGFPIRRFAHPSCSRFIPNGISKISKGDTKTCDMILTLSARNQSSIRTVALSSFPSVDPNSPSAGPRLLISRRSE